MDTSVIISLAAVLVSLISLIMNGRKGTREDAAGTARLEAKLVFHPAWRTSASRRGPCAAAWMAWPSGSAPWRAAAGRRTTGWINCKHTRPINLAGVYRKERLQ